LEKSWDLDAFTIHTSRKETLLRRGKNTMNKYACQVCGYVYDPVKGDPDTGISAGTRFEDLPGDRVCPLCGASKDMFEKVG
jgi:rubredoxin